MLHCQDYDRIHEVRMRSPSQVLHAVALPGLFALFVTLHYMTADAQPQYGTHRAQHRCCLFSGDW